MIIIIKIKEEEELVFSSLEELYSFERYDEIIDKAKEMAQNESQKNYKHKSLLRCF